MEIKRNSALLKALGHPVRLKMVEGLMRHTCNVGEIVRALKLPQSTVSQHLGILRTSGVIVPEKDGVITCYRVTSRKARDIIKVLR